MCNIGHAGAGAFEMSLNEPSRFTVLSTIQEIILPFTGKKNLQLLQSLSKRQGRICGDSGPVALPQMLQNS